MEAVVPVATGSELSTMALTSEESTFLTFLLGLALPLDFAAEFDDDGPASASGATAVATASRSIAASSFASTVVGSFFAQLLTRLRLVAAAGWRMDWIITSLLDCSGPSCLRAVVVCADRRE